MDIDLVYMRVAYAALLFIFVFCGVLRRCNLWSQPAEKLDELYPARKTVTCVYFSVVLLLPCALHPQSADAQLLARCFWVLFVPAATALSYKRFFFGDRLHRRLRIALVGGVPLAFALVLSGIAMAGGDMLMPYKKVVINAAGVLGALLTAYEIHVMIWLGHIMSGADTEARAADRLFPSNFASRMLLVSSVVLIFTWIEFLEGTVTTNTFFAGGIALAGAGIIIVILHPQRVEKKGNKEEKKTKEEREKVYKESKKSEATAIADDATDGETGKQAGQKEDNSAKLPVEVIDRIEGQVRDAMERGLLFLEPEASVALLASRINVNEKYINTVLRLRFGRFKTYLNSLRIEYSMRYIEEHPDTKSEEVAKICGFKSSRSYFRAKNDYMSGLNAASVTKTGIA